MSLFISPRSQAGKALPALLIVLLLGGIAAGGWWGWQYYQQLVKAKSQLAEQVVALNAQLSRQHGETQAALAALEKKQADLAAEQVRERRVLSDLQSGGQQQWLLNEARALASLASQRLLLTQDHHAALRLLQAADNVLVRLDTPEVLPAREALAVDMDALRAAAGADVQGAVLRLGALRQQVSALAVPATEAPPERDLPDVDLPWWQDALQRLPISVHHHEGPVPLPLNQEQAMLVRLTLDGSLQQAQLALMQGRAKAYQQAIDNARQTVSQWFRVDDPLAQHFSVTLKQMDQEQWSYRLPEIGRGLAAIEVLRQKGGGA